MDDEEQGFSQESMPDLPLSQDTLNQLINASGITGLTGDNFETFQISRDYLEENEVPNSSAGQNYDTELQVSRTIIHATAPPVMPQWGSSSQSQGFAQPLPASYPPFTTATSSNPTYQLPPTPSPHFPNGSCMSGNCGSGSSHCPSTTPSPAPQRDTVMLPLSNGSNHGSVEPESPMIPTSNFFQSPSPSTPYIPPLITATPLSAPGPSTSYANQSTTPSVLPFRGDYGFDLFFEPDGKKISKSAKFTYSRQTKRAYVMPRCSVSFSFSFEKQPPPSSFVHATPVYNDPEFIGDKVACCLTHIHEQREEGRICPSHFIRPQDKDKETVYRGNGVEVPLSVATPFSALQQKTEFIRAAVYEFPCPTSNLTKKKGQFVQVVFTLECGLQVLGRCILPIRVCTSPGRDRANEERKLNSTIKVDQDDIPMETRSTRKRGASSSQTDVYQYTMPPKRPCVRLSEPKVQFTITTHKELIPFIQVCVQMMERVNSVPVPIVPGSMEDVASSREVFPSVGAWLGHIGLSRYASMLQKNGVTQVFQIPGITENDLKSWGMRTVAHRKKFLEEKGKVIQQQTPDLDRDSSPPLFPSLSPPNLTPTNPPPVTRQYSRQTSQNFSQGSTSSSQPVSQAFEVVQIQLRKRFSDSSNSPSSSQQ